MEIVGILETGIGLVLVYLTLSLICSAWTGLITHRIGLRGENLHRVVSNLFYGRNTYWLASAAQIAYLDAAEVESVCKARGGPQKSRQPLNNWPLCAKSVKPKGLVR